MDERDLVRTETLGNLRGGAPLRQIVWHHADVTTNTVRIPTLGVERRKRQASQRVRRTDHRQRAGRLAADDGDLLDCAAGVPRPDDGDDVIGGDVRMGVTPAELRVERLVTRGVVARLETDAMVARAKAMPPEHELDRVDHDLRRLGAHATAWEVRNSEDVGLASAGIEELRAPAQRELLGAVVAPAADQ